jgi:hypothetical protein
VSRWNEKEEDLINVQISEGSPVLRCIRNKPKEMDIMVNRGESENSKILVELQNHKTRDVLALLIKLIVAECPKKGKTEEKIESMDANKEKDQ